MGTDISCKTWNFHKRRSLQLDGIYWDLLSFSSDHTDLVLIRLSIACAFVFLERTQKAVCSLQSAVCIDFVQGMNISPMAGRQGREDPHRADFLFSHLPHEGALLYHLLYLALADYPDVISVVVSYSDFYYRLS